MKYRICYKCKKTKPNWMLPYLGRCMRCRVEAWLARRALKECVLFIIASGVFLGMHYLAYSGAIKPIVLDTEERLLGGTLIMFASLALLTVYIITTPIERIKHGKKK